MLALYRSGRQAEALEAFTGRRALVEELASTRARACRSSSGDPAPGVDLAPARAMPAEDHFEDVARAMLAGRVVRCSARMSASCTVRLAQRFGYPGRTADKRRCRSSLSTSRS